MTGIKDIHKLRGLDFSVPESIQLFKDIFTAITSADSNRTYREKQFDYIVRNAGLQSKDYVPLFNEVMDVKNQKPLPSYVTVHYSYATQMYNLDMCSDWDINDSRAIVNVALNLNVPVHKIFDFIVKHKLTDNYGAVIEQFAERNALPEADKIEWATYLGHGVKTPVLENKALEVYKGMGFRPKYAGKTDTPSSKEKAITEYLIAGGVNKIDDFGILTKSTYLGAERSLKYQILFNVWLAKIEQEGFTTDTDKKVVAQAITNKVLNPRDYFYINLNTFLRIIETETIESGPELLQSLEHEVLVEFASKPWAIPVVETVLTKELNYNAKTLLRILSTNSTYGDTTLNHYKDTVILNAFMETVSRNSKMAYYNICRWLPEADTVDNMVKTPITQVALATVLLLLRKEPNANKKELRKLNRVLPGILNEEGRQTLIQKFLPKAETILKLESLYSDLNLIGMVAMRIQEMDMTAPNTGIEF